jgi:hypothetical protein
LLFWRSRRRYWREQWRDTGASALFHCWCASKKLFFST